MSHLERVSIYSLFASYLGPLTNCTALCSRNHKKGNSQSFLTIPLVAQKKEKKKKVFYFLA